MPWKDVTVDAQRQSFCYRIVANGESVSAVCREAGISRKTAYKWLKRYRADPLAALSDRSRRPRSSPGRTRAAVEQSVLAVRDTYRWGGRKIQRVLADAGEPVPSIRSVSAILKRHGRVAARPEKPDEVPPLFFQRSRPNELWQFDHQGPREIGRRRCYPFSVIDDHSRFCLCYEPLPDTSMVSYWPVLWRVFGEFGLPEEVLCDNMFGPKGLGMSQIEMRLIRLGINPIHGRYYHPQTQGKIERLHHTVDYELLEFDARCDRIDLFRQDRDRWLRVYNHLRPHESLGDKPPISRWRPADRRRPAHLPPVEYDAGQILRKVSQVGDIRYQGARISVARALIGQFVRVEEHEHDIGVFYAWKQLRTIRHADLKTRYRNELI